MATYTRQNRKRKKNSLVMSKYNENEAVQSVKYENTFIELGSLICIRSLLSRDKEKKSNNSMNIK